MKKQFKALTLALALLTTTACGTNEAKEAKIAKETRFGRSEVVQSSEKKVANVDAPKAGAVKVEEKDNRNYLIPQTVDLEEKEEMTEESNEVEEVEEVAEEITAVATEQTPVIVDETVQAIEKVRQELPEVNKEVEAINEVEFEEVAEVATNETFDLADIDETSETSLPNAVEQTVAAATVEEFDLTDIETVSEISESQSLPNTVEEEVVAAVEAPVAEDLVEADQVSGGLTVSSPSIEEIRSYWMNYQTSASDTKAFLGLKLINPDSTEVFTSAPNTNLNSLNVGSVSQAAQEDALHIANTARFAAGITNQLTIGNDQAKFAQAASMINRLNLQVNHFPSLPAGIKADSAEYANGTIGAANSNLALGFNILDSVVEYLRDDIGEQNQTEVGHRRWVLNPQASLVGFGQTDEFSAMFVNNDDYAGENANTVYAYPGQTAISEFHSEGSSLSLMFGENFELANAEVEVTDLATGQVNTESHVDESFKGSVKAITFGYGMNYAPGTKLQVKVTGVTKDGQEYPVEYTINYMSLN